MERLRTAVVGFGRIGVMHAKKVYKHDGFDLRYVIDPVSERREEAESNYGVETRPDITDVLSADKVDLVVVASPNNFHAEQTCKALEAGIDVFCDKPMATNLADAERMAECSKKTGQKLMLFQPHRLFDHVCVLRDQIIPSGVLGSLYMVRRARSTYVRRNDWQARRAHGGGMLFNHTAHEVDLLLHLAASRMKKANAALRSIAAIGDAEDVVEGLIETANNIVLQVSVNRACIEPVEPWRVMGTCGCAVLDEEQKNWRVQYFRPEALEDRDLQEGLAAADRSYNPPDNIPWRTETFSFEDANSSDYYDYVYEY